MKYLNENSQSMIRESSEKNIVLSESARRLLDEYNPQETEFLHRILIREDKKGISDLKILGQERKSNF